MFDLTLLWLLLIPAMLSAVSVFTIPIFSHGRIDRPTAVKFAVGGLFVSGLLFAVAINAGKAAKMADTEIWNGQITGKDREHGHYLRPYSCNCRTDSKGHSSCATCYENRYTVTWTFKSTIGDIQVDHLDSSWRSVYQSNDPILYQRADAGDPCSRAMPYVNYLQAVPDSLFHAAPDELMAQFWSLLPDYPIRPYDLIRLDRVLPMSVQIEDPGSWNRDLAQMLKLLGPAKQVNAIVVLANTDNPDFVHALRTHWEGGNKNDAILAIGAPDYPNKAAFAEVIALTENNIFQVSLRDAILDLETLSREAVLGALQENITRHYVRKPMADFAYLEAEIDPPAWMIVLTALAVFAAYLGFHGVVWYRTRRYARRFSHPNTFTGHTGRNVLRRAPSLR